MDLGYVLEWGFTGLLIDWMWRLWGKKASKMTTTVFGLSSWVNGGAI